MIGEGGQALFVDCPVRADTGKFGERLPAEEDNILGPIFPGKGFPGYEWHGARRFALDAKRWKRIPYIL